MARPGMGKVRSWTDTGWCVWTQQRWGGELVASPHHVEVGALYGVHLIVHLCVEQVMASTWTEIGSWLLIAGRMLGRTANDVKNYWNSHLNKRLSAKAATRKVPAAPLSQAVVYRPQAHRVSMERASCCARWIHHGKEVSTLQLFATTGQSQNGRPIPCSSAIKLQSAMV
ncbi:transcription factor MYB63-like [Nymphaea colorata]|uniref:transcription factor MYB63-like n=1 Tax=Nymphaea colorata TaxID=210225 RepID=UPI00129D7E72|nr:transcription factor MYB63-like [Nymphaea colorata]XP_031491473.1 transcription factor MYB63-like [Nymphaea colorata]XP_031491474.1 transcription factor MYB63-like [Nymphaea colorata]XP_031491475.1 transcription factor MYB63-like [Nymphaea colorata]XP_049934922.1 transcription factor MYB63-like [Nymphaea colorata]XP_049934923.1 transcription factor MYB63-like [Nymphaea colorata]